MIALRNRSDVAVRISAKQSTRLTRLREDSPLRSSCQSTTRVRMLAGMLPLASRITAGQWMLLAQPCAALPPVSVAAAEQRSEPTAADAGIPKNRISNGGIREPPPTDVRPTRE